MSHKFVVALLLMALVLVCLPALAQDSGQKEDKTFKLLRGSGSAESELELDQEAEEIWEPALESGSIEVSFSLGFLSMNKTILAHDQIIYKYNQEATYWGDMEITGKSAFNPALRLGYTLTPWISVEAVGGLFFADYTSSLTNRHRRPNEANAPVDFDEPALGEFDAEARSLAGGNASVNAVFYPLNLKGGEGRMHPFLTGGLGRMWYTLNSNYVDEGAGSNDLSYGGGFRYLFDKNISLRLEFIFHSNTVQFTPAEYFTVLDAGTTQVPLNEYPFEDGRYVERVVTEFQSESITTFNWSIGVQGTF